MSDNLFSSLFRWAHRQDENFTTEALVWLLRFLLKEEQAAGSCLLWWMCYGNKDDDFEQCPIIRTQYCVDEGRPDICVETANSLILIEVKLNSGLGADQINRYMKAAERLAEGRMYRVVLLTKWPVAFSEGEDQPHHHLRWHELANELERLLPEKAKGSAKFALGEFLGFLKENVMTIERVGWEYASGVNSMLRLLNMMGNALEQNDIPKYDTIAGRSWHGHYFDNRVFWTGIYYSTPTEIVLKYEKELADKDKFDRLADVRDGLPIKREWSEGKPRFTINLDDENICFFSLSKESQLAKMTLFISEARELAKLCRRDTPSEDT